MHLAGRHLDGRRNSIAVGNQVELRSKPAPAAAQSVVGRFVRVPFETFLSAPEAAHAARTLAPSTHHRSRGFGFGLDP
jgi:hypothetical protein